jgi:hypothetical protein
MCVLCAVKSIMLIHTAYFSTTSRPQGHVHRLAHSPPPPPLMHPTRIPPLPAPLAQTFMSGRKKESNTLQYMRKAYSTNPGKGIVSRRLIICKIVWRWLVIPLSLWVRLSVYCLSSFVLSFFPVSHLSSRKLKTHQWAEISCHCLFRREKYNRPHRVLI